MNSVQSKLELNNRPTMTASIIKYFLSCLLLSTLISCEEKLTSIVYQVQKGSSRWELSLISNQTFKLSKNDSKGTQLIFLEGDTFRGKSGHLFLNPTKTASGITLKAPISLIESNGQLAVINSIEDERLLVLLPKEDCLKSTPLKSSWILIRGDELNTNDSTVPFYGQTIFKDPLSYNFSSSYPLSGQDVISTSGDGPGQGKCSQGVTTWGEKSQAVFTSNGLSTIITDGQIQLFLIPAMATNLANLMGEYTGLIYRSAKKEIVAAQISIDKLGEVLINSYSNENSMKTNATGDSLWAQTRWTLLNNPKEGFVTTPNFHLNSATFSTKLACQTSAFIGNTQTKIIACTGSDPDSTSQPMSFIFVSK